MADFVYIANAALDLVGQSQIVSLDDATISARKAKLHIYEAVREVLKLGKWKPARKRAALAQLSPAPAFGWTYQYQLPADYLRMVMFNETDPTDVSEPVFQIEGKVLLTDESSADICYVADLTYAGNDINVTDAAMTELFTLNLAVKLCWPFQQSRTLRESLLQEYAVKRRAALAADAQETKNNLVNRLHDSTWLHQRSTSTNG